MGTSALLKLASPPAEVASSTDDLNQIIDALEGNIVMRNTFGVVTDGAGDIGQIGSGRPDRIHVKSGITVNGQTLNTAPLVFSKTGIQSGAAKASGFPQFLTPAGGTGVTVDVLGATTPLELTIDGEAKTLEVDLTSDALSLAPSATNTALINDAAFDDSKWTEVFGEYGGRNVSSGEHGDLTIDNVGASFFASIMGNSMQVFKKGDELFLALIKSATVLTVYRRGIAGTARESMANNDTITCMQAHYVFLEDDLATIHTTPYHPTYADVAPSGIAEGIFYFNTTSKIWYRYSSGGSWEALGFAYLGFVVCDDAGCKWAECADFELGWQENIAGGEIRPYTNTLLIVKSPLFCNVAGQEVAVNGQKTINVLYDMEDGETFAASKHYFVYVDKNAKFYLSTKMPRKPDLKKAWYHPEQYWRCFGVVYANSSAHFQAYQDSFSACETIISPEVLTGGASAFFGIVPVGTILPWDKSMTGVPQILPDNWHECDGSTVTDSRSPMFGQTLRNINGLGQFIRGAETSGTAQSNQNKSHTHTMTVPFHAAKILADYTYEAGGGMSGSGGSFPYGAVWTPVIDATAAGSPDESRPDNISMVFIVRIF